MNRTPNKQTVQAYMDAYNLLDHPKILACLTEDVEWIVPGAFHWKGKAAFDKEVENGECQGKPAIRVTRLTEENDVVVAEGFVYVTQSDGKTFELAFCDVFEMKQAKVKRLISYLMPIKEKWS